MHVNFSQAKAFVVEMMCLASLVLAGVSLVLIEVWGILKIWHVMQP